MTVMERILQFCMGHILYSLIRQAIVQCPVSYSILGQSKLAQVLPLRLSLNLYDFNFIVNLGQGQGRKEQPEPSGVV